MVFEKNMKSIWSTFWKTLILSEEPFNAVKRARDGFCFSLKLFLLVVVIASIPSLAELPKAVAQPTLAERVEDLAQRIDDAAPMAPWFLSKLLDELAAAVDDVARTITTFEPPLGVRPSRLLRDFGAWLESIFNVLAGWLGMAFGLWVVARFMGGNGSLRVHMSLVLLAVFPLVFSLIFDFLGDLFTSDLWLVYIGWIIRLGLWLWGLVIAIRALSIAHTMALDKAVAVMILWVLFFVILLPMLFMGIVAVLLLSTI
jgi:hypothetical protein